MSNISSRLYGKEITEGVSDLLVSHNIPENLITYGANFDSRSIQEGSIFFALETGKSDGHQYVKDAINNGAGCVVVTKIPTEEIERAKQQGKEVRYVQVKDSLLALQAMANYFRKKVLSKAKVIAVTGSVGKTSITQSLGLVLSEFRSTHAPQKNFNNHIGVPITILNAPREAEALVLELGINHENEMATIASIARPDIAIITNIYPVHVGNFNSSVEKIAAEKAELFKSMAPNGIAILNQSNEQFAQLKSLAQAAGIKNILSVGEKSSHLFVSACEVGPLCTLDYEVTIKGSSGPSKVSGVINSISSHDAFNSLFVYAVARLFGLDDNIVSHSITRISVPEGRGNLQKVFFDGKKVTLINGTYNASLPSMKDGIEAVAKLKEIGTGKRTVCVIADMLELGEELGQLHHKEIGQLMKAKKIDKVITIGDLTKHTLNELDESMSVQHFKHSNSLSKKIRGLLEDGDIVLFKGSNRMNLSVAIDKLYR